MICPALAPRAGQSLSNRCYRKPSPSSHSLAPTQSLPRPIRGNVLIYELTHKKLNVNYDIFFIFEIIYDDDKFTIKNELSSHSHSNEQQYGLVDIVLIRRAINWKSKWFGWLSLAVSLQASRSNAIDDSRWSNSPNVNPIGKFWRIFNSRRIACEATYWRNRYQVNNVEEQSNEMSS